MTYDFAILVGLYTAIAAVIDIREKRVPNYVTVPAAVLGLAYHTFVPHGMGPLMSLAGFAVGFGLLLLPWLLGGGGMGDVKLLAALGAWLGPMMMLVAFALSAVFAAFMCLGIIAYHTMCEGVISTKRRYLTVGNTGSTSGSGRQGRRGSNGPSRPRRRTLPFAVPVALGTWLLLFWFVTNQSVGT